MNMNKQQLYESIMKNVAIQVKKALNEGFEYETNEVAEAIKKIILENANIEKVCANAEEEDWKELVEKIVEIAKGDQKIYAQAPHRIANIESLAIAILSKIDSRNIQAIKFMQPEELDDLAVCLGDDEDISECSEKKEVKECGCKDGKCIEKKEVKESLNYKFNHRHTF